ncbi:MAG: HesA/MoeB/ThiF family protein [Desulfobacteraceae bacterium]|jgi:molybdopterin/thiamine biosynthesis adenylyltransferase|nr:HesA/MoeB/ThiF family protein [Desulfobacteraceae bacterium]
MQHLLQSRSKKINDPAGREVEILEDSQALKIAAESGCSVHDVYVEALGLGIYPYRYLRNRETISPKEQLKLSKARVAVVGAGGLGGQVILLLARVGVGHIVVVDYDRFDETNLNRQALSSQRAMGKSKAEEAVMVVGSINPGVIVTPHQVRIDPSNAREVLGGSDVVVDALDNIPARFTIEDASKSMGIPLVHGALAGLEGQLMTVFPDDPGIKRLYGSSAAGGERSKSPEAILGVPTLMPSFIATLQAMEVLKILLKRGRLFRNVMVHVDLESGKMNEFTFGDSA